MHHNAAPIAPVRDLVTETGSERADSETSSISGKPAASTSSGFMSPRDVASENEEFEMSSVSGGQAPSSVPNSLPPLDDDASTASESDSVDVAREVDDASAAASFSNTDSYGGLQVLAAAQPPSTFSQQLMLHNHMSEEEEEHEPMHKWLESNSDPWAVPKLLYGESRAEHELALRLSLAQFDTTMLSRANFDG